MEYMGATTKTLYETDFVEWAEHTAELLRSRHFEEVDLENLVEEVESLAKRERSAARSQLRRMLMHLVKMRVQPQRAGASWRSSVVNARIRLRDSLEDSPSLRRHLEANLQKIYWDAVAIALAETKLQQPAQQLDIPDECPVSLGELLEADLDTLWPR
jgi:hypothetical protein